MTTISEQQHMDSLHLDTSWQWLCQTRQSAPANADIWDLRYRWPTYRENFLTQLQSGEYRLSPMRVVGCERQVMWSAEDALALKWVALQLVGEIPLHEKCEHLKGHGGGQASVQRVQAAINTYDYSWVCRTDIRGYYGAINTDTLLLQLTAHITRPALLSLLRQFLHYIVEEGGNFHTPSRGIARSCALSPLMGALHLWVVDNYFATQEKIYYARYMDDFLILTPTRWSLRRQVKQLNRYLNQFGFEKHPEKTFIGRIAKGFDWMGAWLTDAGVTDIAPRAKANHQEKLRRLYEQTQHWPKDRQRQRVSEYKKRWERWFGNDEDQKNTESIPSSLRKPSSLVYGTKPQSKETVRRCYPFHITARPLCACICFTSIIVVGATSALAANDFSGTYAPGAGIIGTSQLISHSGGYLGAYPCNSVEAAGVRSNYASSSSSANSGWGISSDGLYQGLRVGGPRSDIFLVYTGTLEAENPSLTAAMNALGIESTRYTVQFSADGSWYSSVPSSVSIPNQSLYRVSFYPENLASFLSPDPVDSVGTSSMSVRLYIGPNAEAGTYNIPRLQAVSSCRGDLGGAYANPSIVNVTGRECTISVSPLHVSLSGMGGPRNELIGSGAIQVRGNCLNGDSSTEGNMQFSIITDTRTTSPTGISERALSLMNNASLPVGSVTFNLSNITGLLALNGAKYGVPVTWGNVNFDVLYNVYNQKLTATPAYGVGRGTVKFLIEWP